MLGSRLRVRSVVAGTVLAAAGVGCQTPEVAEYHPKFPGVVKLDVTPKVSSMPIEGSTSAIIDFKAMATYSSGETKDLSKQVTWSLDVPSLGSFAAGRFQSTLTRGGRSVVTASADSVKDQASITLIYVASIVRSSAPPDAPALFRAAMTDSGKQPLITGPADGAIMPRSPPQEFTWSPAGGTDLFELQFANDVTDIRIYTRDPRATPSIEEWSILTGTNPGDSVDVTVRGMAAASPSGAGRATPIEISFPR